MFSEEYKTKIKNIINNIDLSKANLKFAWKIAHEPLLRSILVNKPFESVLGIDAVGSDNEEWKASMIMAILYVGSENETGKVICPPEGVNVEEFARSCAKVYGS